MARLARSLNPVFVAAVTLLVAGCNRETPTQTGPVTPSASGQIVSMRIEGPQELPPWDGNIANRPRSVAQYAAIAKAANGTSTDVTTLASWNVSGHGLDLTHISGELRASNPGEAVLTATFGGASTSMRVLALEPGTFPLKGRVTSAGGRPLERVEVAVAAGTGPRYSAWTNAAGQYALFGVAGPVDLRVSAEGFSTEVLRPVITEESVRDVVLNPLATPAGVAGEWAATLSAPPSCQELLPAAALERRFDVIIVQNSAQATVTLTSVTDTGNHLTTLGTVVGDVLSFETSDIASVLAEIGDQTPWSDYAEAMLVDRLDASDWLAIALAGSGRLSGSEIPVTMQGGVQYGTTPWSLPQVRVCRSNEFRLTLRRK